MKYFKVSNTQAITNTCNNINWNEFPGCSRLKFSFWSSRVEVHFDTSPPHPLSPHQLNPPYLTFSSWLAQSHSSWQSPINTRAHEFVQATAQPALPTHHHSISLYCKPMKSTHYTSLQKSPHSSAPNLHSNPSLSSLYHVYFPAH